MNQDGRGSEEDLRGGRVAEGETIINIININLYCIRKEFSLEKLEKRISYMYTI